MANDNPTRWDVSNVFPGLESPEFKSAVKETEIRIKELSSNFETYLAPLSNHCDNQLLNTVLGNYLENLNTTITLQGKISNYLYAFISTDSYNKLAQKLLSEFELLTIETRKQEVVFKSWLKQFSNQIDSVINLGGNSAAHAFYLKETIDQSRFMMSTAEEALAAELNLSGATAWEKLQGTITSQLSVNFELNGEIVKLPAPALINLRSHPQEDVRKRAYQAELVAWKTVEEPLAAALNGIKGSVNTLNRHRGRQDAMHSAIEAARIDRETLEVMLSAMHDSFPMFRDYFKSKANRLGHKKLAWWNLFAPVGKSETHFTFNEARQFIVENFQKFDQELAEFADQAFENYWIDAEQRDGKSGGAFCMEIPGTGESRILCNFDGSLEQVSTIAHELGHGFHNNCKIKAGRTQLQKRTPMTLAETASIMCETIVANAALEKAATDDEELAILESMLINDSQVIVDIYSRYLFEKEVFEQREKSELSADEFNTIMECAQKETYGDGLDEENLQKYMWTWKPHYYSDSLSFYNFPYAFGLLFATGLYAIYKERGKSFIPEYKDLLASTGLENAADLAMRFGINIKEKVFWNNSLAIIHQRIKRYQQL
jgi:pepF/M3 family oligoendopeptidase